MKFYQQQEGEWIQPMKGYRMACCDCGLVHRVEFRVVKGRVQFRAWRDKKATTERRKKPKPRK
jgi:Zn-finger protein